MATLTPCQQKAAWLAEAIAARHQIIIGGKLSRLTHADKTMEWHAGNRYDLDRYISGLQRAVDACNGVRRCPGFLPVTHSDC